MKPYIKQRPFSQPSSARKKRAGSWTDAELALAYLDQVSCFETLRAYGGRLFRVSDHLSRLYGSVAALGKRLPFETQALARWLESALRESGLEDALLRLSVHWSDTHGGRLVLIIREFRCHPDPWYEKGVELGTAVGRRWTLKSQDPQIKASQYVSGVLAVLDQETRLPHELIFLDQESHVAEGSVSNIFVVGKKRILTPSVGSGILRGVTRAVVMELAGKRGLDVVETRLTRHEVYSSEECFITNTSSEVLPVVAMDGHVIGSGRPGPVTRVLAEDFKKISKGPKP